MDDRERIEALAADGRLTREEADRLLGLLEDIDEADRELDGPGRVESTTPAGVPHPAEPIPPADAPRPPEPAHPPDSPLPPEPGDGRKEAEPSGISWLHVNLLAGDLEIEVDESLKSPQASGHGPGETSLEMTADGARLGGFLGLKEDNFVGRVVGRLVRGKERVFLPAGWGVRLSMKAGDVEIRGPLAYLAGDMLAGDLDADELHGIDLRVKAGDIDVGLKLNEGQHRLHALAGDVNVQLREGSSASVRGNVNVGGVDLPEGWPARRQGLGYAFGQTLGSGAAQLELNLGTGELQVEVDDG